MQLSHVHSCAGSTAAGLHLTGDAWIRTWTSSIPGLHPGASQGCRPGGTSIPCMEALPNRRCATIPKHAWAVRACVSGAGLRGKTHGVLWMCTGGVGTYRSPSRFPSWPWSRCP